MEKKKKVKTKLWGQYYLKINKPLKQTNGVILDIKPTNQPLKQTDGVILDINPTNQPLKQTDGVILDINPFTAPACKLSGLKSAHIHAWKWYIWWSCNKSTFNTVHFDRNPFTCSIEGEKNPNDFTFSGCFQSDGMANMVVKGLNVQPTAKVVSGQNTGHQPTGKF